MIVFDQGIIYEISRYLAKKDYLVYRCVFRILGEPVIENSVECAVLLLTKKFKNHWNVYNYSEHPSVAILSAEYAYYYSCRILKGRWIEAEDIIFKNPFYARLYGIRYEICRERMEKILMTNIYASYNYARFNIYGRWLPGEKIISTHAYYSYWYALNVVNGVWPPGEQIILTIDTVAYLYARDIIKGRWPLADYILLQKSNRYVRLYNKLIRDTS